MPVSLTVAYPNDPGVEFDQEYYVSTHMPLVHDCFRDLGMLSWSVVCYRPGLDGTQPTYRFASIMIWKDEESINNAMVSPEAATVISDIWNYTKLKPTYIISEVIASSEDS